MPTSRPLKHGFAISSSRERSTARSQEPSMWKVYCRRTVSGGEVHLLRKRWNIPTVKINRTEHNPRQWPDGTYSVQGAAEALSISTQTVFKWRQKGRLSGHQIAKGMPWQIELSNTQIVELRTQVRRTTLSKKEAS